MIGLITPNLSLAFFGTLAAGVIEAADERGILVDICNSNGAIGHHLTFIKTLQNRGFRNIILDDVHCNEEQIINLCKDIPGLVLINRFIPQIANRCVCIDNILVGGIAASNLLKNGHENIAFLTSSSPISDPLERIRGAKQIMSQHGISVQQCVTVSGEPTINGGREAVRTLLEKSDKFTGVLAYNDNMATGALNELQDRGYKVPEDISVVGFDNLAISIACRPALTTMDYPIREMAAYAVKLSLELTSKEGVKPNITHRFVPTLIERKSVIKMN